MGFSLKKLLRVALPVAALGIPALRFLGAPLGTSASAGVAGYGAANAKAAFGGVAGVGRGLVSAAGVAGPLLSAYASTQGAQTSSTSIDLAKLRADSIKNGFNPLTVLSNGGAGGYSQTTTPTAGVGKLTRAAALLSGLSSMGDVYEQRRTRDAARARDDLDLAIAREQLDALQYLRQARAEASKFGRAPIAKTYAATRGRKLGAADVKHDFVSDIVDRRFSDDSAAYRSLKSETVPAYVNIMFPDGTVARQVNPKLADADQLIAQTAVLATQNGDEKGWYASKYKDKTPRLGAASPRGSRSRVDTSWHTLGWH